MLRWIRLAFALFSVLLLLSFFKKDDLPPASDILQELQNEPRQERIEHGPIQLHKDGRDYTIHPLFSYSLRGLVVSYHDSFSWLDFMHKEYGDTLNVRDLCVLWGENVKNELYDAFSFSSGDFTCFASTQDDGAWQAFNPEQLSNNHLLAGTAAIQEQIAQAEHGDQIAFQGFLSRYEHDGGFSRGTSTSRLDTGNGACETVFVTHFTMLRKANALWHRIYDISLFGAAATLLAWLALFVLDAASLPKFADAEDLHEQASVLAAKGRFKQARARLDQCLQLEPSLLQAYQDRAVVLEQLGEFELAAADRETARLLELRQQISGA